MLTPAERKKLESDLNRYDNVGDIFKYLQRHYDLDNTKLGMLTKEPFISGIVKGINALNPTPKV